MAKIGSVIDDKYEILKKIGQGGMSVVYLAMDKRLNKQWAVKEIKKVSKGENNQIVIRSLLAEANLMKHLDHPALPRIVDIIDNGETIYVVMDYIEGEPLDRILKEFGAQSQDVVIDWAKQLCDVLKYLHKQNPPIIYRDMKPANVMLKTEGALKVIDFGIAREYKEQNIADTVSLGTKGYAAPEQFGGIGQTDQRTDIYGLGVTLYHLVTGQNPCEPPYELYPIRKWNPALSGGLERIIQKCTAQNPNDRYQNCDELMYALEHYDEIDDLFKKKQKNKLTIIIVCFSLCIAMFACGITMNIFSKSEKSKNYDLKIGISTSTDYNVKIATYKEAIELNPSDIRAYQKLLSAYKDNKMFGDEQANEFSELYNKNKDAIEKENKVSFQELNFDIATTYFYVYSGSDGEFRSRILKSYPYFKIIEEARINGVKTKEIAQSYYIVANFYSEYVVSSTSVKEPTKEDYEDLMGSLQSCIDNVELYNESDEAYIKVLIYNEIGNLLNSHCIGFAKTGISKETVLNYLNQIYDKTQSLLITQNASVELKEQLDGNAEKYIEAVNRAYLNAEEK